MSNSLRKFHEDVDSIYIPKKELEKVINTAIFHNQKQSSVKKIVYTSIVAVIAFTLILGSGFVSPTMAKMLSSIPYLDSVLQYQDKGLHIVNGKGMVTSIGETAMDKDIPITITDVYFDDARLEIGYSISLENLKVGDLKEIPILGVSTAKISIDGKQLGYSGSSDYRGNYIIGTFTILENILPSSKEAELKIEMMDVLNKRGKWNFQFTIKKVKEANSVAVGKSVWNKKYNLTINEMKFTPSATRVEYEFDIPKGETKFDEHSLRFILTDINGKRFEQIRSGVVHFEQTTERTKLKSVVYFEPIPKSSTNMTIIPVIQEKSGVEDVLDDLGISIILNKK